VLPHTPLLHAALRLALHVFPWCFAGRAALALEGMACKTSATSTSQCTFSKFTFDSEPSQRVNSPPILSKEIGLACVKKPCESEVGWHSPSLRLRLSTGECHTCGFGRQVMAATTL